MLPFGRNVVGEFDFTTCGELRSVAVVFQESRNWDSIPFMTDDNFQCTVFRAVGFDNASSRGGLRNRKQ